MASSGESGLARDPTPAAGHAAAGSPATLDSRQESRGPRGGNWEFGGVRNDESRIRSAPRAGATAPHLRPREPRLRHHGRARRLRRRPRPGARRGGHPLRRGHRARRLQPLRDGPGRHRAPHHRAPPPRAEGARSAPRPPTGATCSTSPRPTSRARCSCPREAPRASAQDMQRLVEDLRTGIPGAFETDEYRTRLQEIESEFERAPRAGHRGGRREGQGRRASRWCGRPPASASRRCTRTR